MTENAPKKLPKIPPKWAVFAFLAGAVCAFAAAVMALMHNGPMGLTLALATLVLYLAGAIGYAFAPRRQPSSPVQAEEITG